MPIQEPILQGPADRVGLLNGVRILIIERDTATGRSLRDNLQAHNAKVMIVSSVAQAYAAMSTFHPRLLIADFETMGEHDQALIRSTAEGRHFSSLN
jgi:DNA-binding response OmpR family regulator